MTSSFMHSTMGRRRFLAVSAAVVLGGATRSTLAETSDWSGIALGAEVKITLAGSQPGDALRTFSKVEAVLRGVEEQFSLYRESALTRLNRIGHLPHPTSAMLDLFQLAGDVHAVTGGLFDPTIQPLWLAIAKSGDVRGAQKFVGWERVLVSEDEIVLEPGMQLTFNGMAQGYAADRVATLLASEGYRDVLIDTGEITALGLRPDGQKWRADIVLPDGRKVARTEISDMALAVSSPKGTLIGQGVPHIVNPRGQFAPVWELIAVSAPSAALADGLSTAFCMMDRKAIDQTLAVLPGVHLAAII